MPPTYPESIADMMVDLTELELPDTMKTNFPDPTDVLNFELSITPDEGESEFLTYNRLLAVV